MKVLLTSVLFLFQIALFAQGQGAVLIISDKDCQVSIDGGTAEKITANAPKKISVASGEHFVSGDADVNGNKVNKSQVVNVDADKQKVVKFEFAGAADQKAAGSNFSEAPVLKELSKINHRDVVKMKLVMTKEWGPNYKLDSLHGLSFELDESKIKRVADDLNMLKPVIPGEKQFTHCGVILVYFKNGAVKSFYGNGKRFHEIVNAKSAGEYYTMTAWNIIVKHWELKKELACDDSEF
jgi:hypothetical protein